MRTSSSDRIQFQKGLSLRDFQARYGTEKQCRTALHHLRWPRGFVCPHCGATRSWSLSRPLVRCACCRRNVSLTSGTLFHATKLPLTTWFLAIYFMTQTKVGLSAPELMRHLGINEKTAWLILHKLMDAMDEHERSRTLCHRVELDDAYLGGRLRGGTPGRGSENKRPFVMAVQTTRRGGVSYVCVDRVAGFRRAVIRQWAAHRLQDGTHVMTDGLNCFRGVGDAGCHHVEIPGLGRNKPDRTCFYWLNTILSNLKTGLAGVRHKTVDTYMSRYLALFQFRFNHRFALDEIAQQLLNIAATVSNRSRVALTAVAFHG